MFPKRRCRSSTVLAGILVMVVAMAACNGCATTTTGKGYDVIKATNIMLDTSMTYLGDEYKAGRLSEEDKATALAYGAQVQAAVRTAITALATYKELEDADKLTSGDADKLKVVVDAILSAQKILTEYVAATSIIIMSNVVASFSICVGSVLYLSAIASTNKTRLNSLSFSSKVRSATFPVFR